LLSSKQFSPGDRFIYETEHHNGVAELLEILGRLVLLVVLLPWTIDAMRKTFSELWRDFCVV
jgi:hypothetical protein